MPEDDVLHLALRVRSEAQISYKVLDVVAEHNKVIIKQGSVAVAKYGASLHSRNIERLKKVIKNGKAPCLILISKIEGSFTGVKAQIHDVITNESNGNAPAPTPSYYKDVDQVVAFWVVVSSTFVPVSLKEFKLVSNKRLLLDVLQECRTSMMLVE